MKRMMLLMAMAMPVHAHDWDGHDRGEFALNVLSNTDTVVQCYIHFSDGEMEQYEDAGCNAHELGEQFNAIGEDFQQARNAHPDDHYIDVILKHFEQDDEEGAKDLAHYMVLRDRLSKMIMTMYIGERL